MGPHEYVVGIPSDQFTFFAAPESVGRQRSQNWCWAACIQMVLSYHGLKVTQEQVVSRVFGQAIDHTAGPEQIMSVLRGPCPDNRGRVSLITADNVSVNPMNVLRDLDTRWPLIVGLSNPGGGGHVFVLTAAYCHLDDNNNPTIYQVVLRDPWPANPSRVMMPIEEFVRRCTFATRVRVQRL